jgi:hypothetical protein
MRPIIKQVGAIFACTLFLYILILGLRWRSAHHPIVEV